MKVNNRRRAKMNKRSSAIIMLCIALVLTLAVGFLGLNGTWLDSRGLYKLLPWLPTADVENWPQAISLGLDLRGGVYTVYAAEDDGSADFETKMSSTVSILTSRLTRQGFTEATVTRQGNDRIRVEIPNVSDPNEILRIIGTPAQLYFVDEAGNNLLEGAMIKNAQASQDENGMPCVAFELSEEGAKIFAEATAANLGKTISITLDGETISTAEVTRSSATSSNHALPAPRSARNTNA